MVAKRVKSPASSERHTRKEELPSSDFLSSLYDGKTKQHSFRIMSIDEESAAGHQLDKYAVEIVDSVDVGCTIEAKHSVEMIARHRQAHIEYMAFGDDTIIQKSNFKSSADEADLDQRKDDISSRFNQSKDTVESRYDEARDDVESRIGERAETRSNTTTRGDTVDSHYTDTDGESRFMNSLDEGEFSSDDGIPNFSYAHISDERTPRSLLCDFDFKRDDFRLEMNPNSVDPMESGSTDEPLFEGVTLGSEKIALQEQEATSLQDRGGENEVDKIAEGLRHHTKGGSTLPFSTNEEKLQQDATTLSRQKPPGHILVEKQQWTSAVAESLRRDKAASAMRGECSVDVVHDVVSDLCFVASPRKSAETEGTKVKKFRVETRNDTTRARRLEGLKDALSKRPLSPISARTPKSSTRKSDFKEAICDLCFVGDSSKKLERLESTLLTETALRGSKKISEATNEPDDFNRDRPFDEEESLSHNVIRFVEMRLRTNGNSFASSDLIDLSGNVSLVPISSTLSLRHPVTTAAMMEDRTIPACGAWQVGEVNELLKDVRALMDRKTSSRNVTVKTKDYDSLEENNTATHKKLPTEGASVSLSMKRAMKNSRDSPQRSYSAHKFSKNAASTEMVCSVNGFIGETVMTESNASVGMGVSPSAKTDVSFPYDEGDTRITEVLASREENNKVLNQKVESAIIDNDVEDGASISLKSDSETHNILIRALVATHCEDTGNDEPNVKVQEYGSASFSKNTGADKSPAEAVQSLKNDRDSSIMNDEKALTVVSNEILLLQKIFKAIIANQDGSEMPPKSSFRFDMCHIGESLDTFVEWTLSFSRQTEDKTPSQNKDEVDNERDSCDLSDSIVENACKDGLAFSSGRDQAVTFVFSDEALLEAVKVALENERDGCDSINKDLELLKLSEENGSPKSAQGLLGVLYSMCSDTNLGSKSQAATFDVEPDTTRDLYTDDKTDDGYVQLVASRSIEYKDIEKVAPTDKLAVKPDLENIDSGDQSQGKEHREDNHSQVPPKKEVAVSTEAALETDTARDDVEYINVAIAKYEAISCGCDSPP